MTPKQTLLFITNPHFAKGYYIGRVWRFHGQVEWPVDDAYVIANITGFCEEGLHHHPNWLAEKVGFMIGMISGGIIPEE